MLYCDTGVMTTTARPIAHAAWEKNTGTGTTGVALQMRKALLTVFNSVGGSISGHLRLKQPLNLQGHAWLMSWMHA